MNNKILLAVVVAALIAGAAGFFGGMQYQKSKKVVMGNFPVMSEQFRSGERQMFGGDLQDRGRMIRGEIIDSDEKSITVKLPDGSSRIVFVNDETKISEATPSAKERLTEGTSVFVTGTTNPDGSMNATSIQIGD